MEPKRKTSNLPSILALVCVTTLLSACYDMHRNSSGASSGNLVGVDDSANRPPEDTGNTTTDPTDPVDPTPGDTADADPEPVVIALSWQPTPGDIVGYIVHTGPSPETATSVITVTPNTTVQYDAVADLGLDSGEQSCFRIKAYNSDGQSGFSEAVCYTVNS